MGFGTTDAIKIGGLICGEDGFLASPWKWQDLSHTSLLLVVSHGSISSTLSKKYPNVERFFGLTHLI